MREFGGFARKYGGDDYRGQGFPVLRGGPRPARYLTRKGAERALVRAGRWIAGKLTADDSVLREPRDPRGMPQWMDRNAEQAHREKMGG